MGAVTPPTSGHAAPGRRDEVVVISDTHGLLRPEVVRAAHQTRLLIHAGDVGSDQVLGDLEALTRLHAVRGNVDRSPRTGRLPRTEIVDVGGPLVYVIHILDELDLDPARAGISAVIYGHTHRPAIEHREGVLYLNPGSAGPRRAGRPASMARLRVQEGGLVARMEDLEDEAGPIR
jgi:hypothetical protein